jgi:hypothetical protein
MDRESMKSRTGQLFQFWSSDWSLTVFLVLLVITLFIIVPLRHLSDVDRMVTSVFFSLILVSGVAAVSERRAPTVIVTGVVIVTLGLRWMTHLVPGLGLASASAISAFFCIGLLAGVVLLQVFRKGPISWHRIQGAIAVYLLLGMMWAFAYEVVLFHNPGAFQMPNTGQQQVPPMADLLYFSFVTLTTVGYGDITPLDPISRSLANLEALVGQLYPAILIGRLVSMELQFRQSK